MLHLTYTLDSKIPLEADGITPDRLAPLSPTEIAKLPLQHGNAKVALGDAFRVTGDASDQAIRITGDCRRVKLLGSAMTSGKLLIDGDAGMHLGADMTGGEIHVRGNAGDWAGAEMKGGLIKIDGTAGHQLGAGYRGARHGMTGGTILVGGSAGNEVGSSMRRGLIAIGGNALDFAGVGLIAGSILVFGRLGQRPAAGMKRGTLAVFGEPPTLLPTFPYACDVVPTYLDVYLARLAVLAFGLANDHRGARFRLHRGDRVNAGIGEVLVRV